MFYKSSDTKGLQRHGTLVELGAKKNCITVSIYLKHSWTESSAKFYKTLRDVHPKCSLDRPKVIPRDFNPVQDLSSMSWKTTHELYSSKDRHSQSWYATSF